MTDTSRRTVSLKRGDTPRDTAPRLEECLHKVLAQAGLGSRRALEQRIAYGLVMDTVGFLVSTAAFMLFISFLINKGRTAQNIIVAVAFSAICYGVFGVALKLSLPRGLIESLLPF